MQNKGAADHRDRAQRVPQSHLANCIGNIDFRLCRNRLIFRANSNIQAQSRKLGGNFVAACVFTGRFAIASKPGTSFFSAL